VYDKIPVSSFLSIEKFSWAWSNKKCYVIEKGYTFVNQLKVQTSITFNSKEYDNKVR
jgi:hypothetical protein